VRERWSPPQWLDQRLALVESRAFVAAGKPEAAVDAARRADPEHSAEAAAALARAWLAAGSTEAARQALSAAGPALQDSPDHISVEISLVEGRLALLSGRRGSAVGSVEQALRLAQGERLRLPFILERGWLRPFVDSDPGLARAYNDMMAFRPARAVTTGRRAGARQPAAPARVPGSAPDAPLVVESLTEREREVLQYVAQLLPTVEIAAEMYVSVNTVKSHLKSICRKLGAATRNEAVRRARQLELI
jgi:LuxR family maltose regulon positive regulatory protein